jgi:type IV fimbrial biogenesis protein FimT
MAARQHATARPAHGLTLLELMLALGIVAVLMSLALPSFGSIMTRNRLKAAAEHLALDLAELRLEATQRGVPLHLNYAIGSDWCYALATASGCDCRRALSCQMKTVRAKDHPGVQLVEGQDVLFEPQPGAGVGSGSAVLRAADGAQLRVGLSRLGRPKVCAPGMPVAGYPAC